MSMNAVAAEVKLRLGESDITTRADGHLDVSGFLRAGGKQYKHLATALKNGSKLGETLKVLASEVGVPVVSKSPGMTERALIETNGLTKLHFRGWIHPEGALAIAAVWFSPELRVVMIRLYARYAGGDTSLVAEVNHTKSLLTYTIADKDADDRKFADHVQIAGYQVRYNSKTKWGLVGSNWLRPANKP